MDRSIAVQPQHRAGKPEMASGRPEESLEPASASPRVFTAILPPPTGAAAISRTEQARREDYFAADLAGAMSRFDSVERRAGGMTLKAEDKIATMHGGRAGENVLHRSDENSVKWIQRITSHWAGYLANNGVNMRENPEAPYVPEVPGPLVYREIGISSRVQLALDPEDAASPAMVWGSTSIGRDGRVSGKFSASFDCAMNSGMLNGSTDEMVLNHAELEALDRFSDLVDTFHEAARKDFPEYH